MSGVNEQRARIEMKAVVCEGFTGPGDLVIRDFEAPEPAPDEVLIEVHAATVNFMDHLIVSGLYQMKPELPFVAGTDAAGVVVAIGSEVDTLAPGDRVATFDWTGAFAERMVAAAHRTFRLPDGVDFARGSGILHAYSTGLYGLRERGQLQNGEVLLVNGAAGGVGLAAIDIGRHMGARVVAAVGSDEKADIVRQYGAEAVINYQRESLRDRVRELTDGAGADVIYDPVGGDVFDESVRAVAWAGRILVVGFASGRIPELRMNQPLLKSCSIIGVLTGNWGDHCCPKRFALIAFSQGLRAGRARNGGILS
jgi:NADPH2:quinone reductase